MTHSIYIIGRIGCERPCKIGISADPARRLSQLQTGSAERLEIRHTLGFDTARLAAFCERQAHDHFADKRLSGEWFDIAADEIVAAVRSLPTRMPKPSKRTRSDMVDRGAMVVREESGIFHPRIPAELLGVPISEMSYPDRVRFWSACDLPPPPEGFDDWYLIGTEKNGVLGAFPVVGFVCQEPAAP